MPEKRKFSFTNQKPERRRPFGTGLVRHCPQGLFSPFFTFLRAIYFSSRLDFSSSPLSAPGSPRMCPRRLLHQTMKCKLRSLACVAGVSVWFRSKKDRGSGFSVLIAREMKRIGSLRSRRFRRHGDVTTD